MVLETYQAIREIEVIIGSSLGMRQTGCLYAEYSPVHQKEVRELVSVSSQMGLRTEWLDIIEALAPGSMAQTAAPRHCCLYAGGRLY